ncbi:hypothetical protein [Streptomyces sp. NRRL S-87]|uniref:hypothetical protein n=1 Tax=Streptomyces sp. NRRL S-87 TaxID=1463920 RepID=UPI00068B95CA|nr:hypothetical protein [Streptomyces sp. NRRL S-87]
MRHPSTRTRHRAPAALALLGVLAAGAAGCADEEGLRSEGDQGEVHAPLTLWKDLHPAPPPPGQTPGRAAVVPGAPAVPGGDLRRADVLGLVRADIVSATREDGGTGRMVDPRAVQRLARCAEHGNPGPDCPVRPAVLHDLTGDGKDELITAVDVDGRLSELRVYALRDGKVVRVLSRRGVLEGVDVAGGHLTVREPTTNPGLVSISDYVWDPDKGSMVLSQLTVDECSSAGESDTPCPQSGV